MNRQARAIRQLKALLIAARASMLECRKCSNESIKGQKTQAARDIRHYKAELEHIMSCGLDNDSWIQS
jgi:cytochrome c-type biogenesis protein CcmH/NrfF